MSTTTMNIRKKNHSNNIGKISILSFQKYSIIDVNFKQKIFDIFLELIGSTNHRNMAIMSGGDTRHQNHHQHQRLRENPRLQLPNIGGGKCQYNRYDV